MSEVPLYGGPRWGGVRFHARRQASEGDHHRALGIHCRVLGGRCFLSARYPFKVPLHRGTSLIRKYHPLGPYSSAMPRALWWS